MKPSCSICLEPYNTTDLRPIVGICGHTLCLPCSRKVALKCPTCRKLSFIDPVPNFAILALLENNGDEDHDDVDNGCCHRKFNDKMSRMEKKFSERVKSIKDDFAAQLKEIKDQNAKSAIDTQNINESISIISGNMVTADEVNQKVNVLKGDFEQFKEEIRGTRKRKRDKRLYEEDQPGTWTKTSKIHEIVEIDDIDAIDETEIDKPLKCVHCNVQLPSDLPLREDGVSVRCPTRKHLNIIGKLSKGNRWMMMVCGEWINPHFTQVSDDWNPGDLHKCRLCKKSGKLLDASDRIALPL